MVQYNMVLHISLQEVRKNINQRLNPHKTPYVFHEYFGENWPCYNGTTLYSGQMGSIPNLLIQIFALHGHLPDGINSLRPSDAYMRQ